MRILFVNPPAENEILSCNPEIIKKERGYNPPLGILYIAAYLEKHSSHQIKIIDAQVEEMSYGELEKQIKGYNPDVVGITAMTPTLIDVLKVVEIVKKTNPETKTVLGGPHVSIYPQETINLPGVDFLVLGEGEIIFGELIKNLNAPQNLKKIKGLVFKENGTFINTGEPDFIKDLDSLPFPARHLVPYQRYNSLLAARGPVTTMFTSRGCPYKCTFCYRPSMGKIFRAVSPEIVVDEIELCQKLGIKEIFFYDDTFSVNKKRVIEICQEIMNRRLNIYWDIRTRIDNVDCEMLKVLKKANCQRIHYGVEAGTTKIQKVLQKEIGLSHAIEVFKMTKDIGISTFAYFMIGAPSETKEDILETVDFAKKLNPDYVQITIFTPFPGTQAYKEGLGKGVFTEDYWRKFALIPDKNFRTKYWEENLSKKELQELLTRAYKEFYIRPGYIMNKMLEIKTLQELRRKLKAGLQVIKMKDGA